MNEQDKELIINEIKKRIAKSSVNAVSNVLHEVGCNSNDFVILSQLDFEVFIKVNDKQ